MPKKKRARRATAPASTPAPRQPPDEYSPALSPEQYGALVAAAAGTTPASAEPLPLITYNPDWSRRTHSWDDSTAICDPRPPVADAWELIDRMTDLHCWRVGLKVPDSNAALVDLAGRYVEEAVASRAFARPLFHHLWVHLAGLRGRRNLLEKLEVLLELEGHLRMAWFDRFQCIFVALSESLFDDLKPASWIIKRLNVTAEQIRQAKARGAKICWAKDGTRNLYSFSDVRVLWPDLRPTNP